MCPILVTTGAKAAYIVVIVTPSPGNWNDVIDLNSFPNNSTEFKTIATIRFGFQPPCPLRCSHTTSRPLSFVLLYGMTFGHFLEDLALGRGCLHPLFQVVPSIPNCCFDLDILWPDPLRAPNRKGRCLVAKECGSFFGGHIRMAIIHE